MATITKSGRLTVKVTNAAAETLHRAASLSRSSLDNFMLQAALKEARRVIDREEDQHRDANDPAIMFNFSISRMGPRRR